MPLMTERQRDVVHGRKPIRLMDVESIIKYDPTQGAFYWVKNNERADIANANRGRRVRLWKKYWNAAKLACLFQHDYWPDNDPWYADGNPQNLKWSNLEESFRPDWQRNDPEEQARQAQAKKDALRRRNTENRRKARARAKRPKPDDIVNQEIVDLRNQALKLRGDYAALQQRFDDMKRERDRFEAMTRAYAADIRELRAQLRKSSNETK
jgi:hypothetical protein